MFKPTNKQISVAISGTTMLGMIGLLAYAAVLFAPAKQPIGYIGQPTMSNYKVSSGTEKTYRGEYVSTDWSGRFDCYPVTAGGYVNLASPCFPAGASSPLDAQAAANTRKIGTRTDAASPAGIEFLYANLTAAQKTAVVNAANVDFVRGTSLAPTGLRARTTVLGDIIHSRPYYYTDGSSPTVFVGANDGMLHAFDAATGQERWAYVPSMLLSKLPALSSTSYAHEYYVDGSMTIGKAGNKTVLVGALGAGGKGLYALDISTLTAADGAAAGSKGLWEVTNTKLSGPTASAAHVSGSEYLSMGDTYSNPLIAPTQDGNDSIIVGNGYNNTGDGCAYLYVINAQNGSLIKAIKAGVGACSTTSPNGLSSPAAIDSNGDGKADRVYAGDIDGNMWLFNLSGGSAGWSASKLYATGQSITQAPVVGIHPVKGFMVNFTTGRMLSSSGAAVISPSTSAASDDTADTATQYAAYGAWDNLSNTTITAGQMITQTIGTRSYQPTNVIVAASAVSVRMLTTDVEPDWTGTTPVNRGWKTPFPIAGDRVVGDGAFLLNGKFQFNISNPTIAYAAGAKGENWLMALDYLTGGAGGGPFLNLDRSTAIDDFDRIKYLSTDTLPTGKSVGDPNTAASGIPVAYATSNGVQSQPILIQLSQASVPLYNQNYNNGVAALPPSDSVGIGGGHFDAETFYHTTNNSAAASTRSSTVGVVADYAHKQHDHEYDKKWNVNGLNLLNPSGRLTGSMTAAAGTKHWLGESVNSTTPYKVLVFNQAWNRSVEVKIGSGEWVSTKDYQTQARATVLAGLQTYTGNTETIVTTTPPALPVTTTGTGTITSLKLRMPYNAFAINDWWGDGVSINGLIPLDSSCVKGNAVPAGNGYSLKTALATTTGLGTDNERNPYIGPNGERHDGALTIQIIRADTPDASIVLNVAADVTINGVVVPKEKFGYRVRNMDINKYVMHEESVFWHHDVAPCMSGVSPGKATTTAQNTIPARGVLAAKTGTPASCSGGGTVVPADPLTCKLVAAKLVYTPASCSTGTYTRPKPAYPAYPATAAITGWTPAMPLDRSDSEGNVWPNPTARPCGTDDPHDASFTPGSASSGSGGGGGTSGGGGSTTFGVNSMGGLFSNSADGTGAGGTISASSVATASSVGNPGTVVQTPPNTLPGRLTWRELIGQ